MPNLTFKVALASILAASPLTASHARAQVPLVPTATATVTSNRPTLETYLLWSSISFEVCRDRACTQSVDAWTAPGMKTRVRSPLGPGVYFWRVTSGPQDLGSGRRLGPGPWSATHSFRVPPGAREATADTFGGGFLDVNCDGYGDLAVATQDPLSGSGIVEVFHGSAEGLSPRAAWSLPTATPLQDLSAVGDLNDDNCGELGVAGDGVLAVHPGSPKGLGAPPWRVDRPANAPTDARLMLTSGGSITRNGSVLVVHGGGMVWVYAGASMGFYKDPVRTYGGPAEPGFDASFGGAADFNGDGYGDQVLVRSKLGRVQELRITTGSPLGTGMQPDVALPGTSGGASCIGDVDADGLAELVLAAPVQTGGKEKTGISIYRRRSSELTSMTPQQELAIAATNVRIHCADVNADGRDDVLLRYREPSDSASARRPVRLGVYLGRPDGHLALMQTLREEDYVGDAHTDFAADLSASDLNGDGRLELVLTAPAAEGEAGAGSVLIFADARSDDLGIPTVRSGAPGFGSRVAMGFR